jgi:hypothetical protein
LVVATALTQASNDKQQVVPMLEQLHTLPRDLGRVKRLSRVRFCSDLHGFSLTKRHPRSTRQAKPRYTA